MGRPHFLFPFFFWAVKPIPDEGWIELESSSAFMDYHWTDSPMKSAKWGGVIFQPMVEIVG